MNFMETDFLKSHRIILMGDSITEFWKSHDTKLFEEVLINKGISGQTTLQMILRFTNDVVQLKPKVVVILAGINDIAENTGPISDEDILKNIITMTEMATINDIQVVLCSVLPANKFKWNHKIKPAQRVINLNNLIKAYASKNNFIYVDYYSEMVDSELGLQYKYGEDGVHPNALGYSVMKTILLKNLVLLN